MFNLIKTALPNQPLLLPILAGPFRGARIKLNPRVSLRKIFGIYEHELNQWLEEVLPLVNVVLDVGANDGYFTFGSVTAFLRMNKNAKVIAFEPLSSHFQNLQSTMKLYSTEKVDIQLHQCLVGSVVESDKTTTLDAIAQQYSLPNENDRTLIKIDVEGAELDVITGALFWLNPDNFFLIEVHDISYIDILIQKFLDQGIKLKLVNQQPLPILGRETRSELNWWLVSDLN
jgi:hypothetical protein